MIIRRFTGKNVHGYLDFNINFKEDINFLVGLNGCGKTTALKLINSILIPDVKALALIPFDECEIEFQVAKIEGFSTIKVIREGGSLSLKASFNPDSFKEEIDSILDEEFENSELLKKISKAANPVLVSIDRKFAEKAKPRMDIFGHWKDETDKDPLDDVKQLIKQEIRGIERKNNFEDARLKDKILLDAFTIISTNSDFDLDKQLEISELNTKRELIKSALGSISLRNKNINNVLDATDEYFDELTNKALKIKDFKNDKNKLSNKDYINTLTFMFTNQPQINRIDNLVSFIKASQIKKAQFNERVILFEEIVNSFFIQTGKKISIKTGNLKIKVAKSEVEVKFLSSGETQIITLFAHILFNRKLISKASLMIDEPELSLHLAWQDMFVESLKKANSNLQVILATHSPAIINGNDSKCVFVNDKQASLGLDNLL